MAAVMDLEMLRASAKVQLDRVLDFAATQDGYLHDGDVGLAFGPVYDDNPQIQAKFFVEDISFHKESFQWSPTAKATSLTAERAKYLGCNGISLEKCQLETVPGWTSGNFQEGVDISRLSLTRSTGDGVLRFVSVFFATHQVRAFGTEKELNIEFIFTLD